jgi:hypothetical protein
MEILVDQLGWEGADPVRKNLERLSGHKDLG